MFRKSFSALFVSLALIGCGQSNETSSTVNGWGDAARAGFAARDRIVNMSMEEEQRLAWQSDRRIKNEKPFHPDYQLQGYVQTIGNRLLPYSARPQIPIVVQVIRDDTPNAFATAFNYVYISTGLLRLADNEAQLAGVIGHEISHNAHRDGITMGADSAGIATAMESAGIEGAMAELSKTLVKQVYVFPFSRAFEMRADTEALYTIRGAGYAGALYKTFFMKFRDMYGDGYPLTTHPANSDRISNLLRNETAADSFGAGTNANDYFFQVRSRL
jgi:predicted Zn-dependent protease